MHKCLFFVFSDNALFPFQYQGKGINSEMKEQQNTLRKEKLNNNRRFSFWNCFFKTFHCNKVAGTLICYTDSLLIYVKFKFEIILILNYIYSLYNRLFIYSKIDKSIMYCKLLLGLQIYIKLTKRIACLSRDRMSLSRTPEIQSSSRHGRPTYLNWRLRFQLFSGDLTYFYFILMRKLFL